MENKIDHEIDKKLEELDIIEAIENKDVPYVIEQTKGLIVEFNNKAWDARGKADTELLEKQLESENIIDMPNTHGTNWITGWKMAIAKLKEKK